MSWVFLSLAIATEVGATVSLRASEGLKKKLWLIPIVVGYICAFVFLSMALAEGLALGVAYGIWVACGVALTAISARVFFKEPLTPLMAFGILLIGAGVLVVEIGAGLAQ
ncbi:multidrug efflux SMR transporter [Arthrobacter sp. ISL-95]|uniref:DMT family transporter n=1 Tax=Arthrobacter sp. ISL-95 TaxID=2819116 RepID=UPI001BE99D22|nr:multidrug efflux SMR transporter [Arthrobacter sp. ISL-95]MBT2587133.1 multidrug efflux SMR transporter [Arthrobacter sp. ISL-95]